MEAEINIKSDNNVQEIKLNEDKEVLKLKIKAENGNETGEYLEFNLGDLEYLLILQDMGEEDKKNRANLKNQFLIIDKKQDHKGKKLFSANEEAKIRALNEFFKKEEEIYNMFLGENGVKKLLNGRKLTMGRLEAIDEIIEKQIVPQLEINGNQIKESIMKKYKTNTKRDDVIE